jgi:hypothetical protein
MESKNVVCTQGTDKRKKNMRDGILERDGVALLRTVRESSAEYQTG